MAKQIGQWAIVVTVAALISGACVICAGQGRQQDDGGPPISKQGQPNTRLILRDSDGKNIGEFTTFTGEPVLILRGKGGKNKIWIQVWKDEPRIVFFKGAEQRVLSFEDIPNSKR